MFGLKEEYLRTIVLYAYNRFPHKDNLKKLELFLVRQINTLRKTLNSPISEKLFAVILQKFDYNEL